MDIFFEILESLTGLELIIGMDDQLNRQDIRQVILYSVSEKDNELIVSQTKPPIDRVMKGREIKASFVGSLSDDKRERFFFLAKIKDIRLFPVAKSRLVEGIFLSLIQKKIYKGTLRLYPRVETSEGCSIQVEIAPGDEIFPVRDISEGGLCFTCPKSMLNSIRFIPHKRLNMRVNFPDNINVSVVTEGEVVRRFEKEDVPDIYYVGARFLDFEEAEQKKLNAILTKLREG